MIVRALVDEGAATVYYLAFDLILALAPIRDGAVQIEESRSAVADPADPAAASRLAAVRAALLKPYGAALASDRDEEIQRANAFAASAGVSAPRIPDDDLRTLTLYRDRPTPLG
jgi:hypothetical protein